MKFNSSALFLLIVFFIVFMPPVTFAKEGALQVKVERIKKSQGQLHYQLFVCPVNKELSWQELTPTQSGQLPIKQKELSFTLKTLKTGSYIVRVFQDINNDQQLDYTSSGIPKEPFGFSNNPSLLMGKPMAADVCFNYPLAEPLVIKLNNRKSRKKRKHH